jgi:hypothetical protein
MYGNEPAPQISVDATMIEPKSLKTQKNELVQKMGVEREENIVRMSDIIGDLIRSDVVNSSQTTDEYLQDVWDCVNW